MRCMEPNHDRRIGLLAGASTGIFWGAPFLAPQILPGFSPVEIAFGRFFFFGVMGLFFVRRGIALLRTLSVRERAQVFALSALGFWLYSSILFWAISMTNGVISSLVLGLLPVTIPLFTPGRRSGGWRFYSGLIAIAVGLWVLLGGVMFGAGEGVAMNPVGIGALFLCLAMWTGFAIWNSSFLTLRPAISKRDFSSLMGLVSLLCLTPLALSNLDFGSISDRPDMGLYILVSAILGVGASWFANWLWNVASARLPSSVSGTLLVFETLFGLLYTFIYQQRWPQSFEMLSIVLCLAGVALAIRAQITS